MNTTIYRQSCGTHLGLIAHQAAEEPPCGECRDGELRRRASVEAWPIALWPAPLLPISREQADKNLALLVSTMADVSEPDSSDAGRGDPHPVHAAVDEAPAVHRTDTTQDRNEESR